MLLFLLGGLIGVAASDLEFEFNLGSLNAHPRAIAFAML